MTKTYRSILFLTVFSIIASCSDSFKDIRPADERANEAISALQSELTSPANGWVLNYRPTPDAGIFLMVLNFGDDGLVNIKSDVAADNNEYADQTISYRIDNSLGLELIFETYGVFHYLFEQQQASFGAEFEFVYNTKEGNNLIFISKTDNSDAPTVIILEPAASNADNALSIDVVKNFESFSGNSPQISGNTSSFQQVILNDHNTSLFWKMDLLKRTIEVDISGIGTTIPEVITDFNKITHTTGFYFANSKIILEDPITFSSNGSVLKIEQITLDDFDASAGASLCSKDSQATPVYSGQIPGIGRISIRPTLFASHGIDFVPQSERSYSVNSFFVFSDDGFSLASDGSILEKFPTAFGFVFNYGLTSDTEPINAVGFNLENLDGSRKTYLREFDVISAQANMIEISLKNEFYYSTTPDVGEEQSLIEITDEIFESGEIYAYDFPNDNVKVFNFYNPCNSYEFLLVQN